MTLHRHTHIVQSLKIGDFLLGFFLFAQHALSYGLTTGKSVAKTIKFVLKGLETREATLFPLQSFPMELAR